MANNKKPSTAKKKVVNEGNSTNSKNKVTKNIDVSKNKVNQKNNKVSKNNVSTNNSNKKTVTNNKKVSTSKRSKSTTNKPKTVVVKDEKELVISKEDKKTKMVNVKSEVVGDSTNKKEKVTFKTRITSFLGKIKPKKKEKKVNTKTKTVKSNNKNKEKVTFKTRITSFLGKIKSKKKEKKVNTKTKTVKSNNKNKEKVTFKTRITSFLGKIKPKKKEKKVNTKTKTVKSNNKNKEKVTFKTRITSFLGKIKPKKKEKKVNTKTKTVKNNNTKSYKNKNKNAKKDKLPLLTKKSKKWFIIIAIICSVVLLLEGVYVVYKLIEKDKNTTYYDSLNSVIIDDTDIVSVGSSNFRYSKNYNYTNGLEKGKIIKYDKKGKIIFEKMYEKGINNTFSSIINVSDGYIVVGSGVFSKEEQDNGAREAVIIKYDKKGNIVWEKFYHVLTNTRFNKVIETKDGYIAIGQSIYANMEMGNHTTGGGIIVKYDKDGNEIWHNNHGGTKSGNFNDIVEINGSFYIAGKDGADSGNIVKFSKNGKYEWHKNYSYTDGIGLTGIAYLDNSLYVVGSKKILPNDYKEEDSRTTNNTDALLVVYDLAGNKKFEKTFGGSNYERYNSILSYNNNLYVVGHTSSKDAGFKITSDGELMTGLVVRYDKDGNILKKEVYGGSNNDNLTDIITDGVCLYISGYSNSKDGNIITSKNNGKDYFGKIIKLDLKFRIQLLK